MRGGFIWDDDDYLINNPHLADTAGLAQLWVPRTTRQYYPMVFTTFWLEHQLWGLHPTGYHIVNVLLHIASALLAWRVFTRLGVPGAWMIGAVFALHPVHVESVAWITERKNVLSAFFYLLAALAYLRFDRVWAGEKDRVTHPAAPAASARSNRPGGRGSETPDEDSAARQRPWLWYAAALGLFVLALLTKSVTCSLPAAIVLAFLWLRRRLTLRRLALLGPFFAVGLALALHTAHLERTNVGASGPDFEFSVLERCLIASRALLFYPWKIIAPWPLVFIYPRWEIDASNPAAYGPVALVLTVGAGAAWLFLRGRRGAPLALAFYAGTMVPALGFFNVYPMIFSFVADHFQYLASLGTIALLVGSVAPRLPPGSVRPLLAALVLAVLGGITWQQGYQYASTATLWRTTLDRNPSAWIAHNNLGLLLREAGDHEAAIEHFKAAIALKWDHHRAHANLAETYRLQGRLEESLAEWRIAISQAPPLPRDMYRIGRVFDELGRADEAMDYYRRAIDLFPDRIDARFRLAAMLAERGRLDEAAEHYAVVARLDETNFIAHGFLADYALQRRQWGEAIRHYEAVLDWSDDQAQVVRAMDRWAWIKATCPIDRLRSGREAVEIAERAADQTRRAVPKVLDTLAAAYAEAGRFDDAARTSAEAAASARAMNLTDLAEQIEARRQEYLAGRPWREPAAP